MYGGEETTDDVLVEVSVLTHLVNLLPLDVRHLFTNHLSCHLLTALISAPQLRRREGGGGEFDTRLDPHGLQQLSEHTLGLVEVTEQARKASL